MTDGVSEAAQRAATIDKTLTMLAFLESCIACGESLSDADRTDLTEVRKELRAASADVRELREALGNFYDKWENGTQCYEDPEDCTGFLGHAVRLSEQEEVKILQLLGVVGADGKFCKDGGV